MALYIVFTDELKAGLGEFDLAAPLHPAEDSTQHTPSVGDEIILRMPGSRNRNRTRLRIEMIKQIDTDYYALRLQFPKR